jgi:hypothetical protein
MIKPDAAVHGYLPSRRRPRFGNSDHQHSWHEAAWPELAALQEVQIVEQLAPDRRQALGS